MVLEQGGLCAYTMWPLGERTLSHIEHIRCQRHFREDSLDFENMLLCVRGSGDVTYEFGATKKADAIVTAANFVSPLQPGCEERFRFALDGSIVSARPGDLAAKKTIALLDLSHGELRAARRRAVRVQLLGEGRRAPLSASQARRLADQITAAAYGVRLPPFCIAIKQAALRFAAQREKFGRRLATRKDR